MLAVVLLMFIVMTVCLYVDGVAYKYIVVVYVDGVVCGVVVADMDI